MLTCVVDADVARCIQVATVTQADAFIAEELTPAPIDHDRSRRGFSHRPPRGNVTQLLPVDSEGAGNWPRGLDPRGSTVIRGW